MASGFVFDKDWVENLAHTRGTLNPVGDKVRTTTDKIAKRAQALAKQAAREAATREESAATRRYTNSGRSSYQEAKAEAWALDAYADSVHPEMAGEQQGEDSTTGKVVSYYPGAVAIEFGGQDIAVKLGDDGPQLLHTAHGILRRAVDGS
jgi:metal-dependent amidase/aminoacylase/carboxypeptidase family protein